MNRLLLENAVAQAEAFCMGRTYEDVVQEMVAAGHGAEDVARTAPHRVFHGGRPSTFMLAEALTPRALGALIAAHEHKIFLEGVFWNLFSFDQWGVELGKAMAKSLASSRGGVWTAGTQALKRCLS